MHFGERHVGSSIVKARIISDHEGDDAGFRIGKSTFKAAETVVRVQASGHSMEDLEHQVAERDPEGAPGIITVDPGVRVAVETLGDGLEKPKPVLFKGPLEIVELVPIPADPPS